MNNLKFIRYVLFDTTVNGVEMEASRQLEVCPGSVTSNLVIVNTSIRMHSYCMTAAITNPVQIKSRLNINTAVGRHWKIRSTTNDWRRMRMKSREDRWRPTMVYQTWEYMLRNAILNWWKANISRYSVVQALWPMVNYDSVNFSVSSQWGLSSRMDKPYSKGVEFLLLKRISKPHQEQANEYKRDRNWNRLVLAVDPDLNCSLTRRIILGYRDNTIPLIESNYKVM